MKSVKRKIDLEAIKSHVLWYMWRKNAPVTTGEIKSELLGYNSISFTEVYDNLFALNYIAVSAHGIELSEQAIYALSGQAERERTMAEQYLFTDDFEMAVLSFLCNRPHLVHIDEFPELLIEHAPQREYSVNKGNLVKFLIECKYVENPETNWYSISETGINYFEFKSKYKAGSINMPHMSQAYFSENEREEMNGKLDEIIQKLADSGLEHEAIWSDMKADFEELKNLYSCLTKKNMIQLVAGKLFDWTVGGIVSETLSKQIIQQMKPDIDKLLS